jgi:hypothetical protein
MPYRPSCILAALAASAALAALGLTAAGAAAASPATVYVSPSGSPAGTDTSCATAAYSSIQAAVNAAGPGGTVLACAGTYHEQVTIAVPGLTLTGAGPARTVIEPTAATPPGTHPDADHSGQPTAAIVYVAPGTTGVTVSDLAVEGSALSGFFATTGCADDFVGVWFDESSGTVSHAAVSDIILPPGLQGCQDGLGVLAQSPSGTSHVTVARTAVANYGKNGITCKDAGTICNVSHDTVTGSGPDPFIAQNGVEIAFGAGGTVSRNTITGNECDDTAGGCGPDPLTGVQATGVLVFNSPSPTPAGTSVDHNLVYGNDLGIYTDDGIAVSHNNASRNRYIGIFADSNASGAAVDHNTADAMTTSGHGYGIYVNANHGNAYSHNQATGNTPYDLYANAAPDNIYRHNQCQTAFPSKAQWHC